MPWMDAKGKLIEGDVWPLPSDAFAHPRSVACFSRFVNKYVMQYKNLSLIEAMERTSLNACRITQNAIPQMLNKGRIQVGKDADITIFDLAEIKDKATFTEPNALSVGVKHLIVNGKSVIENAELDLTMMAGEPIRNKQI